MTSVLAFLASTDPTDYLSWGRLLGPIYSTGIIGLVFAMLIFEKGIVTKRSLDRTEESHRALDLVHANEIETRDRQIAAQAVEIAELKASSAELQRVTNERMIPALVHATDAVRAYVVELAKRGGSLG